MTTAELHGYFLQCEGTCTDTRQVRRNAMFFALKGPNFNANLFAADAVKAGCLYAVVDAPEVAVDDRFLLVPDVLTALQDLARHHRRTFDLPVLGITGSNGKTTTKELVHAVMLSDRNTLATIGNLNNHIGVPLTLLRLNKEHRFAIIEMGANKVGDIAELTAIAEPTHGMITNIGKAHLEGFGGPEGVVRGKTEMYAFLRSHGGTAFVNADDALLMEKSEGLDRITYGTDRSADLQGTLVDKGPFLCCTWKRGGESSVEVATKLVGAYNLSNLLAAVCIGDRFGVPFTTMAGALTAYAPSNNRSQFVDTGNNHVVMDAYNANPTSMKAALENFAAMASDRPKLAILGGMKELGDVSHAEHATIIALVERLGLEAVFVGPEFMALNSDASTVFPDVIAARAAFEQSPRHGALILVKGSRGTTLESLVDRL